MSSRDDSCPDGGAGDGLASGDAGAHEGCRGRRGHVHRLVAGVPPAVRPHPRRAGGDPPRRRRRAVDARTAWPTSSRRTPLTPGHRFRIASHSKTFTATAVMRLVDQGRLRLDDPVGALARRARRHPARRRPRARAAGPRRRRRARRLGRRLLAALPGVPRPLDAARHRRRRRRRARPQRALQVLQHRLLAARAGHRVGDRPAVRRARARRDPRPAGPRRHDAGHRPGAASATTPPATPASAYADHRLPIEHIATGAMASATGFSSTATGSRALGGGALPRRHPRAVRRRQAADAAHGVGGRAAPRRGTGSGSRSPRSARAASSATAAASRASSPGPGGTRPTGWRVAVLTNAIDGPALTLANAAVRLVDLALGRGEPTPRRRPAPTAAGVDLAPFCGRFANLWGVIDVVALGGRLYLLDPTADDPVGRAARGSPSSTSGRCGSPTPRATPRPASGWSTSATTTAASVPCGAAAGRRRTRSTSSRPPSPVASGWPLGEPLVR